MTDERKAEQELMEKLGTARIGQDLQEGDTGLPLSNFAYHISCIMTDKAGTKFGLCYGPLPEHRIEVRIESTAKDGEEHDIRWDSVYINDVWCGNRCGGREVYTAIVAPFLMGPNLTPSLLGDSQHNYMFRDAARAILAGKKA